MGVEDTIDVAVIAAKPDEHRLITEVFRQYFGRSFPFDSGVLFEVPPAQHERYPKRIYLTTCGKQGNIYAGITVAEVMFSHHPSLILFVGTAGSLNAQTLRVGDVVLPCNVQARLYNRVVEEGQRDYETLKTSGKFEIFHDPKMYLIPGSDGVPVHPSSLAIISQQNLNYLSGRIASPYQGAPIASIPLPEGFESTITRDIKVIDDLEMFTCDWLVNSEIYRKFIVGQNHPRVVAVDTESFGHLKCLQSRQGNNQVSPKSLIVRGISDYAGRRSQTQKDPRWGIIANRNAAIVAAEIIAEQFASLGCSVTIPASIGTQ